MCPELYRVTLPEREESLQNPLGENVSLSFWKGFPLAERYILIKTLSLRIVISELSSGLLFSLVYSSMFHPKYFLHIYSETGTGLLAGGRGGGMLGNNVVPDWSL